MPTSLSPAGPYTRGQTVQVTITGVDPVDDTYTAVQLTDGLDVGVYTHDYGLTGQASAGSVVLNLTIPNDSPIDGRTKIFIVTFLSWDAEISDFFYVVAATTDIPKQPTTARGLSLSL